MRVLGGLGLFLRVYLAMAGLLFMVCKTEERSILEGAFVLEYPAVVPVSAGGALIDGNFKTQQ